MSILLMLILQIKVRMVFGMRVGDLVFAKCDDVWYNAKILRVHSDHLDVEFVDYGRRDVVSLKDAVKDVRYIPREDECDENIKVLMIPKYSPVPTHILDQKEKFVEDIFHLLKSGKMTNSIRIVLEDGEILANKDVLSARCEYFATMFKNNNEIKFIEGETKSVDMSYCTKVVMEKIIDYLFSGEMRINDLNLDQLLKLMNMASLILLDDVFVNVENFIIGWLPDSGVNCAFLPELVSGLMLAEQFKLDAVKDLIKLELHKSLKDIPHIPDVVEDSLSFKFLPYSLMKDILLYEKEEFRKIRIIKDSTPSTRQKFDVFVFWLSENDCSEEEKKEIVDSFNFDDFTAEELLTEVRLSGLYSISIICSKALEILHKKDELLSKQEQEIKILLSC